VKSRDKFDIVWRDRKEGKSDNISQTEFIVSDKLSTSDNEEDFLYKVIKWWFKAETCLHNIVRTIDGHDQTSLKEGELNFQHSNDNATVPMSTLEIQSRVQFKRR
jgi:hypothetical protein